MTIDPLTAIGLGANVLQFVEFAIRLIGTGKEIHNSVQGTTVENADLEAAARTVIELNQQVFESNQAWCEDSEALGSLSAADRNIELLGAECNSIATELLSALDKLKAQNSRTKWDSVVQALKTVWARGKIDGFRIRLKQYRAAMESALLVSLR